MTTESLPLFKAMTQKMDWLEQRQKVLAENISNADTPHYKPKDLVKQDFKALLEHSRATAEIGSQINIRMATTTNGHIGFVGDTSASTDENLSKAQRDTYEIAPAGNSVILEEQLMKQGEVFTDHRLITTLYQKNLTMLRRALGTSE